MHRLVFLLTLLPILFLSACNKDEDGRNQTEVDRELILQYLADNNIDAEEHESGLFYLITREGNGERPTVQNEVTVKYKGFLLNGNVFDQTTGDDTITFPLGNLIPGWQIGIPLIDKGGAATLFLPSALGYGPQGVGTIPPNSVLIFDIELVDFQ